MKFKPSKKIEIDGSDVYTTYHFPPGFLAIILLLIGLAVLSVSVPAGLVILGVLVAYIFWIEWPR